jgi:hypothetical protein
MRNPWLDAPKLADKIVQRHRDLLVEAVRKELEFVALLEILDEEQAKIESDNTTIE